MYIFRIINNTSYKTIVKDEEISEYVNDKCIRRVLFSNGKIEKILIYVEEGNPLVFSKSNISNLTQ